MPMAVTFGSKEWFDKLREFNLIPGMFTFYLLPGEKRQITAMKVDTKSKTPGNVSYKSLVPTYSYHIPNDAAIVGVSYIETEQDYYDICVALRDKWGHEE